MLLLPLKYPEPGVLWRGLEPTERMLVLHTYVLSTRAPQSTHDSHIPDTNWPTLQKDSTCQGVQLQSFYPALDLDKNPQIVDLFYIERLVQTHLQS